MKSGLEGRNNKELEKKHPEHGDVSMKSGLEGRNNSMEDIRAAVNTLSQ